MNQKHGKYDKTFAETNYSFCAMVWDIRRFELGGRGSSSSDLPFCSQAIGLRVQLVLRSRLGTHFVLSAEICL